MYLSIGAPGIATEILEALLGAFKAKYGGNGFKYENLQMVGVTTFLAFSPGEDWLCVVPAW